MVSVRFTDFKSKRPNPQLKSVDDITPEELHELADKVLIVDVRRPDEWIGELGHIPGSQLMTLEMLPMRLTELPTDRTIVFVCRSGNRSAQAAAFAKMQGFESV